MPRLCEPFAGLGSFSLRCLWEAAGSDPRMRWEPPVSRQGSKSGFVINEFRAFGLVRQKWDAVLLNDLDPVCHLFHMLYASSELRELVARRLWAMVPCPECLPLEVNAALDGQLKPTPESCKRAHEQRWQGTALCPLCANTGVMDARQLWEKIRKEPVPGDLVEACACALFMQSRSFQLKPVSIAGGAWDEKGYKKEVDDLPRAPTSHAAGDDSPCWTVAERVAALPGKWVESGYAPEINDRHADGKTSKQVPRDYLACAISLLPGPGGCHIGISRMDALEFVRGLVLGKDDVLICDPPYEGTSGYQAQSCRADVLEIARMGHEAGALVLLHESVGLAKELGEGWHQRSASPLRGRASTFHAGGVEREWLTMNRAPVWWPAEQSTMFGGGR